MNAMLRLILTLAIRVRKVMGGSPPQVSNAVTPDPKTVLCFKPLLEIAIPANPSTRRF